MAAPFITVLILDMRHEIRRMLASPLGPRTMAHIRDRAHLALTCRTLYQEEMEHHRLLHLSPDWRLALLNRRPDSELRLLWFHWHGMTQWTCGDIKDYASSVKIDMWLSQRYVVELIVSWVWFEDMNQGFPGLLTTSHVPLPCSDYDYGNGIFEQMRLSSFEETVEWTTLERRMPTAMALLCHRFGRPTPV